jgi:hypothetical protein
VEVDVLRQEVQMLRTELSNRLCSFSEEIGKDLSDMLQKADLGVSAGTSCARLSIVDDDTSKRIVKDSLELYNSSRKAKQTLPWKVLVVL